MKVSIIVPTYNEEKNINKCLYSLVNLDYPKKDYEIIVVDGMSQDKTRNIVKKYKNVRLFENPKKFTSSNRNLGIKNAKYNYIAFTDADCFVPENWLKILTEKFYINLFFYPLLAGVGGANIAPNNAENFTKAIWIAQSTFLGNRGSAQGRRFKEKQFVESLSTTNVLYDKKKLLEVGCFEEKLKHLAEDAHINFRLRQKGYKLLFIPKSYVYHNFRTTPKKFFNNMVRYGLGRMNLIKKYPESFSLIFLIPILFLIGMFMPFLALINKNGLFVIPWLYFPFIFSYSGYLACKHNKFNIFDSIVVVYVSQHFGYALGMIKGLFTDRMEDY